MRKIIDTDDRPLDWEEEQLLKRILNVETVPRYIIFETIEEDK